jgi:hypothetical protein
VARAEVEVAAATYLVYYGNHMAKEDELVLEPAAPGPLFGESPAERYQALRRQIGVQA